jgi:HAD superfamily hydrolase (TIGR01509 family)
MELEALIFDCDGVLVDTEKDGHRVSFNMAFAYFGIHTIWDESEYKELVKIAGGKERMKYFFDHKGWPDQYPDREKLILDLHKQKTQFFMELIESGALPLRPGIKRIVDEAIQSGVKLAVCSTSNEKSVTLIVEKLLGMDRRKYFQAILAGDIVSKKKPNPEIYNLCTERLAINPKKSVVVEDSRNGLLAAKAAGFNCLVTTNDYTIDEDFSEADRVVDELGDEGEIRLRIGDLVEMVEGSRQ